MAIQHSIKGNAVTAHLVIICDLGLSHSRSLLLGVQCHKVPSRTDTELRNRFPKALPKVLVGSRDPERGVEDRVDGGSGVRLGVAEPLLADLGVLGSNPGPDDGDLLWCSCGRRTQLRLNTETTTSCIQCGP